MTGGAISSAGRRGEGVAFAEIELAGGNFGLEFFAEEEAEAAIFLERNDAEAFLQERAGERAEARADFDDGGAGPEMGGGMISEPGDEILVVEKILAELA